METKLSPKKINLIPNEMAVPAAAVKTAKLLSKVSIIAVIILIITALSVGGLFFYFSNESTKQVARISTLKTNITNLQQNEQKLVLAKDRLAKIKIVQEAKSVNSEVTRFKDFSDMISTSGSTITEANLTNKGTEVSLLSADSESLSLTLKPLATLSNYKTIVLSSLGYNPGTGFISTIVLGTD